MKIRVFAPSYLNLSAIDDQGYVSMETGSTVNGLFKKLGVPLLMRPFIIYSVNYKAAKLSQKLQDGDTVSMMTPVSGG